MLYVGDFQSPKELAAHLKEVASNKDLYESYLAWRSDFKGMLPPFTQIFLKRPSLECWLCQQLARHVPVDKRGHVHKHEQSVACAKPDLSCRKMQNHAFKPVL